MSAVRTVYRNQLVGIVRGIARVCVGHPRQLIHAIDHSQTIVAAQQEWRERSIPEHVFGCLTVLRRGKSASNRPYQTISRPPCLAGRPVVYFLLARRREICAFRSPGGVGEWLIPTDCKSVA